MKIQELFKKVSILKSDIHLLSAFLNMHSPNIGRVEDLCGKPCWSYIELVKVKNPEEIINKLEDIYFNLRKVLLRIS